jgi:hypothetical protein
MADSSDSASSSAAVSILSDAPLETPDRIQIQRRRLKSRYSDRDTATMSASAKG